MKKKLLSAVVLCSLGFVGCGDDTEEPPPPTVPKFDTADNIRNYLDGKKMLMEGGEHPHPSRTASTRTSTSAPTRSATTRWR